MNANLDLKRIYIFLAFAFGIAWLVALVIYFTGGLANSPMIAPNLTLAIALMATFYMWAPAAANVLTRLITHEGWTNTGLRPHFRKGWPMWIAGWFLPPLLTILGAVLFYAIFPQYFDPQLGYVHKLLMSAPQAAQVSPQQVIISQFFFMLLAAPLINSFFTFGEEFGWRAYLLPKLMPLGARKTILLMGIIWGVWHWPVIFMGYEYGFKYFGAPVLGPFLFCWITFGFGALLAWVSIRGGSVWPAVIGHAAINSSAGLAIYFMQGQPSPLLGPLSVGLIGSLGFSLVGLAVLAKPSLLGIIPAPSVQSPNLVAAENGLGSD